MTNNTSAKLQALIADQTLLLRHHKRRQQQNQQQRWQTGSGSGTGSGGGSLQKTCQMGDVDGSDSSHSHLHREEQLQSLLLLQQQLAAATKEHFESSTSNFSTGFNSYSAITMAPLRRCSSLSQTANCENSDLTTDGSTQYVCGILL